MSFRIRQVKGDEWRLWRSLRLRAVEESPNSFRSTLREETAEADERWRDLIRRAAEDPRGLLLVAEVNADPVGMLFGRLDAAKVVLDVGAMWVDPDVRRKGVGRGMLDFAIDWARSQGAREAELWVTMGNEAAEKLYESSGFAATSDVEPLRDGSELNVVRLSTEL